jgi:prepilin-type processing-associated H-X9-DG protein
MSQAKDIANLVNRLENWKFKDANQIAQNLEVAENDCDVIEAIQALADMFGNVGWFDGSVANLIHPTIGMIKTRLGNMQ